MKTGTVTKTKLTTYEKHVKGTRVENDCIKLRGGWGDRHAGIINTPVIHVSSHMVII